MNERPTRHAYLIVAHGQFRLLRYQLSLLDDPRNDLYIHLDAKVKEPPYDELKAAVHHSGLFFTGKRHDVGWGAPSQTQAEMSLYELAAREPQRYAYYHLLSGVCLPLRSQDDIHQYLTAPENAGKNFLTIQPRHSEADYERFSKYHFRFLKKAPFTWLKGGWRLPNYAIRLQRLLGIDRIRGRFPFFCRGQNWCSLTPGAVICLLNHAEDINQLIKHTTNADEGYKQLFIYNDEKLKETICRDANTQQPRNLMHTVWDAGCNHPRTLTLSDYDNLITSPCLFARKFSEEHWELVEKIGAHIRLPSTTPH